MKYSHLPIIIAFLLTTSTLLSSCSNMEPSEIEKKISSGIVMVKTESYYEVKNDYLSFFTSDFEEEGLEHMALNEDEIEKDISYGTGFFISPKGEVATNAHVVRDPTGNEENTRNLKAYIDGCFRHFASQYIRMREQYEDELDSFQHMLKNSDDYSQEELQGAYEYMQMRELQLDSIATFARSLKELENEDFKIIPHSEVSIVYNDHLVTSFKDFTSCVVKKIDPIHDLAIIQLKDKTTPAGKYVFPIPENDPLENYSLMDRLTSKIGSDKNNNVYMMAFNLGPKLAFTEEGVQAQFLNGSISQRDARKIMYSIPALHGSSGSPVVNQAGELIAINFAGLDMTQGFNYGVRVKHLHDLINN